MPVLPELCGTTGQQRAMEAIEIMAVDKGK